MRIDAALATHTSVALLEGVGVPTPAARIQAALLVDAELRGHPSHGLWRLPRVLERIENGVTSPTATGQHNWRGDALLEVDGENGLGPVVASAALEALAVRVSTTGVACAAINANNHLGMLAWYAGQVARAGHILIAVTTSEALVHPWGGRRAMLGSNPLAIGVPAEPDPLVLDMATAAISMGKVHDCAARNQPLESGWAVDADGEPTRDANRAIGGALTPFGGPKGYGLGVALEALVGSLTNSALGPDVFGTLDSVNLANKGDVFVVIDPLGHDRRRALGAYFDAVRSSPRQNAGVPILIPGDRSRQRHAESLVDGIDVPDALWSQLVALGARP